jgi:hypothetical protein
MSNVTRIPFTEIWERAQRELVRDKSTDGETESKYMGFANGFYMTDMMLMLDEKYLRTQAFISTKADYATGTVDISASGTTVDGGDTSPVWTAAVADGFLFKEDSNDLVARVDRTTDTQLTFQNSLTWPHDAVDEGSYRIVLDRYTVASDFSHMAQDNYDDPECVYYPRSTGRAYLTPLEPGEYDTKFAFTHGTPTEYTVKYDAGTPYLYINPPDTTTRRIFYNYIPILTPMTEYTTGTVTTTADPTVEGAGGMLWNSTSNIDTSTYTYYFRVDRDGVGSKSIWYEVSSITDADTLELTGSYAGTAGAGLAYTISRISRWPARFDTALIYATALGADARNADAKRWEGFLGALIPLHKAVDGSSIRGQKSQTGRGFKYYR